MVEKRFKEGDKIIKARAYSEEKYCYYGGEEYEVPIGTKGEVIGNIPHSEQVSVQFKNGVSWGVHSSELDLIPIPKIFIFRK